MSAPSELLEYFLSLEYILLESGLVSDEEMADIAYEENQ
jgi:hypothetical protein